MTDLAATGNTVVAIEDAMIPAGPWKIPVEILTTAVFRDGIPFVLTMLANLRNGGSLTVDEAIAHVNKAKAQATAEDFKQGHVS